MKRRALIKTAAASLAALVAGCCKRSSHATGEVTPEDVMVHVINDAKVCGYEGPITRDPEFGLVITDRQTGLRATIVAEPIARPPV